MVPALSLVVTVSMVMLLATVSALILLPRSAPMNGIRFSASSTTAFICVAMSPMEPCTVCLMPSAVQVIFASRLPMVPFEFGVSACRTSRTLISAFIPLAWRI